jgi:translation initiation factor 3 subunit C
VWNTVSQSDKVKEMIKLKIKEQSLRTYLFAYSGHYDSLSLTTLSFVDVMPDYFDLSDDYDDGDAHNCMNHPNLYNSIHDPSHTRHRAMFDMSEVAVHSLVSKMIINDELAASHDQPTKTLIVHKAEPSRLQSLAVEVGAASCYVHSFISICVVCR